MLPDIEEVEAEVIEENSTELVIPKTSEVALAEDKPSLVATLEEHGLTDEYMAKQLKYIADNAVTATNKGDLIEDFSTKLRALAQIHKMKSNQPDVQIQIANIFGTNQNNTL